jgi:hypothetical protein
MGLSGRSLELCFVDVLLESVGVEMCGYLSQAIADVYADCFEDLEKYIGKVLERWVQSWW